MTYEELIQLMTERQALIVHCSRPGKATSAPAGLLFPEDLRNAITICGEQHRKTELQQELATGAAAIRLFAHDGIGLDSTRTEACGRTSAGTPIIQSKWARRPNLGRRCATSVWYELKARRPRSTARAMLGEIGHRLGRKAATLPFIVSWRSAPRMVSRTARASSTSTKRLLAAETNNYFGLAEKTSISHCRTCRKLESRAPNPATGL